VLDVVNNKYKFTYIEKKIGRGGGGPWPPYRDTKVCP